MAYTPHNWGAGEAITAAKLNNIEEGINSNKIAIANKVDTSTINSQINTLQGQINEAMVTANEASSATLNGTNALSEITRSYEVPIDLEANGQAESLKDLFQRLNRVITPTANIASELNEILGEAKSYKKNGVLQYNYETFPARLNSMESQINTNISNISTIFQTFSTASEGYGSLAERLNGVDSNLTKLSNTIGFKNTTPNQLYGMYNTIEDLIGYHKTLIANLQSQDREFDGEITTLQNEINGAHRNNVSDDSLKKRFGNIESNIGNIEGDIGTIQTTLNTHEGRISTNTTNIGNNATAIGNNAADIAAINTEISEAKGKNYTKLKDRLSGIDTSIGNVDDKITNALIYTYTSGGTYNIPSGGAYSDLKARLDAIQNELKANVPSTSLAYKLSSLQGDINAHTTEIEAAHVTGADSLDARFDAIDGGSIAERTLPNLVSEVETARGNGNTSLNQRLNGIDNTISAMDDAYKAADNAINTAYQAADNEIKNRLGTDVGTGSNVTTGSASAQLNDLRSRTTAVENRATAVEGRAGTLESNVRTIAQELAMLNTQGAIKNTNTKIDDLERDIQSFATELAMTRDQSGALIDTNTAVDQLDARLDMIDGGTKLTGDSLVSRVSTNEEDIDDINAKIGDGYNSTNTVKKAIQDAIKTAADDATSKANAAQAAAEATASTDATAKANAAKDYADSKFGNDITTTNTVSVQLQAINAKFGDGISSPNATVAKKLAAIDNKFGEGINSTNNTVVDAIADAKEAAEATAGILVDEVRRDINTQLSTKADATTVTNLNNTVNNISTTIVLNKNQVNFDSNNNPTTFKSGTIKSKDDYLIQSPKDDKYYYWKYINNEWHLMGGAGSGNTAGYNMTRAEYNNIQTKAENTDYYVLEEDGKYHHYRYTLVNKVLKEIEIGNFIDTAELKRYNMIKSQIGEGEDLKNYLDLYEFDYGEEISINPDAPPSDNKRIAHILLPQGGGGGVNSGAVTRFIRLAPTSITTIQNNDPIYIHFFYSCVDPNEGSFEGHYTLTDKNGVQLLSNDINSGSGTDPVTTWPQNREEGQIYNDGYGSIDVAPYCVLGKNTFSLVITTGTNESFTRTWTIDIKQLNLESTAPDSSIVQIGETINLAYIPYGAMEKTLIVKVDGEQVKTESLGAGVTGTEQICTIPAQSVAGAHTIELRLSVFINGETKTSNPIIKDYIWYNPEDNNTIIISSPYRNKQIKTIQYSEIMIPYTIYKANTNNFTVEYYYDYDSEGENIPFNTVSLTNTNSDILRYIPTQASFEDSQQSTVNNKVYIPNHLTIKVEDTILTFDFIATPMEIDIAPVSGEVIDFDPTTLNNNSINRLPSYLSVSDNFNWSTNWEGENQDSGGGYRTDEDGKCFVIKAGTYVDIDYKMFKQYNIDAGNGTTSTTSSVFNNGAEMKIIFKVTNVRDASTTWFTNMGNFINTDDENAKKVGIQLKAHEGWLKTDKASDRADTDVELPEGYVAWSKTKSYAVGDVVVYKAIIYQCIKAIAAPAQGEENSWNKKAWQSLGQLETEISATNSYLYFPYSENDKIELDININKHGNNQNFIMSYEDGVPSKAYPYDYSTGGDILYHALNNESKIHIGSPDCDVHIYRFRVYNKSLSTEEILKNFIADGNTIEERIARYDRNSIYYNSELNNGEGGYTPYKTGAATLDPYRLAERIPDVKILMLEAPRFTTGKKDFVKGTTLRCIQAAGGKVYPANLEKDNWYFFNGYHAGQGTTSDNYGQSARNVDFLFECDGSHAPTKTSNLSADEWIDYVSELAQGENASVYNQIEKTWKVSPGVTTSKCQDWMGDDCKVSLTHFNMDTKQVTNDATSIPNNYFNLKVNVASSENVNNALFQKRYNDFLPYTSPAKNRDSRIKNDMEFVPAVLFIRENDADLSTHKEFNDTNWHFYALGNLGDSKKTDYTRAYDPTDMYEFTIEISDNNTANSQFQSGVFLTDPNNPSTATVETQVMADNPNIDQDPMKYIYPITSEQWNAKDGNGQYINYRHKTLSTDPFDGDHSFEFRYACCGAFRDGDIINPYNENDPKYAEIVAQGETNRAVWEAFYEWIVTSTEQQFRDEAALWFVPSAVEFFYAFTHYYTMMDNRAKNTFWHFAKTGTWRKIPIGRAVPALYHIYEESDGTENGHKPVEGVFNNTKQYYTQYAFDLWVYDTDTACGIDNNGELSFPYGKEDRDYRVADQAASGWAFNGSGSIFWRRLSDPNSEGGFANEISTLMRKENDNCFATAQHLINQFDEFQNCFPEEIWRLDIERKYIRTFTGASIDGSIQDNKQNIRFLRAMMQGRKKYQRRQWVRNQAVYFGSKYGLSNVRTAEHTIEFNIYTPSSDGITELAVPVDQSQLVIKPYQDMYIDVAVGNSTTNLSTQDFKRAKAGERIVVDCRSGGSAQETRVYIFGGEHIAALENLAPMYTYSGSFGQGKHLKVLDLGSDNPNYNNPRFDDISINPNMPLLERFSVKNCNALAQSIDLHLSNNLREFEADGSLITGVSLPNYSNIEILHLPTSVTSVVLNSARALNDFYIKNKSGLEDYSNLITLNINDSDYSENIDWIDIASKTLDEKINWLYLQNLVTASIRDISDLDKFRNKKEKLEINYGDDGQLIKHIVLSGLLNVTRNWSSVEKEQYETIWPGLTLDVSEGTEQRKVKVIYYYDYAPDEIIYTLFVDANGEIPDIKYDSGYNFDSEANPKPRTISEEYRFGAYDNLGNYIKYSGWAREDGTPLGSNHTASGNSSIIKIKTVYSAEPRKFNIQWFLNEEDREPIQTVSNVKYGGFSNTASPTVQQIKEIKGLDSTAWANIEEDSIYYKIFTGWNKVPANIKPQNINDENIKIYGNWEEETYNKTDFLRNIQTTDNLTPEQLLVFAALIRSNGVGNIDLTGKSGIKFNMGTELLDIPDIDRTKIYSNSTPRLYQSLQETEITPFSEVKDFTLAIDYCFDKESIQKLQNNHISTLVGCYHSRDSQKAGFALYAQKKTDSNNNSTLEIRIGFGNPYDTNIGSNTTILVTNSSEYLGKRNVIVLRYKASENKMYIYSGLSLDPNNLNVITNEAYTTSLSWGENPIITNAPLTIGGFKTSNNTYVINDSTLQLQESASKGYIYKMSYWKGDIGDTQCKYLALWPHEQMEFAISYINSQSNPNTSAIHLISLSTSTYGGVKTGWEQPTQGKTSPFGWENNSMNLRKICNERFVQSLPIKLQSILYQDSTTSSQAEVAIDESGYSGYSITYRGSGTNQTLDYARLFSANNIGGQTGNNPIEWVGNNNNSGQLFSWYDTINIKKYKYTGNRWEADSSGTNDLRYFNLRFPGKANKTGTINIFKESQTNSIANNLNFVDSISSSGLSLSSGDIYICYTNIISNPYKAYMYVTANDILASGLSIVSSDEDSRLRVPSGGGGWIKAENYLTRTVSINNYYGATFWLVDNYEGDVTNPPLGTTSLISNLSYNLSI